MVASPRVPRYGRGPALPCGWELPFAEIEIVGRALGTLANSCSGVACRKHIHASRIAGADEGSLEQVP